MTVIPDARIADVQASAPRDVLARVACLVMLLPQVAVIAFLFASHRAAHASLILALVVIQLPLMARWCTDPRGLAPWYNGTGVSAYVLGMLTAAFALRGGV